MLGLSLFLVCPVVTVVWGVASTWRTPEPFLATLVAQLLATVYLLWLCRAWVRPPRRPGGADLALAVVPLLLSGVGLWLLLALATSYGIRGSAVPRVQQGIALDADVPYLASLAAVVASALVALVLLGLLLRARRLQPAA